MRALQIFRCLVGRHQRDKERARHDEDGVLRSTCTGCGRPMVKERYLWRLA